MAAVPDSPIFRTLLSDWPLVRPAWAEPVELVRQDVLQELSPAA